MTPFKVAIIQADNYVASYDRSVMEGCYFTSATEVTGAASYITYPDDSTKYYVAETVGALLAMANGDAPVSAKNYYALLSQSGTGDPSVYVLNSLDRDYLGDVVWTRTAPNTYKGNLTGQLPVYCTFMQAVYQNDGAMATVNAISGLPDFVTISTTADGKLTQSPVEIKVFLNVVLP
jgi:hypothetical protein